MNDTSKYRDHLRPHTPEEKQKLESSLVSEGCRDPLVIGICQGKSYLIDGFHRLAICEAHGIEYQTREIVFANEEDVLAWMERNSRARRNQTSTERNYYIGCRYNREMKSHGGSRGNQHTKAKLPSGQRDHLADRTCQLIAQEEGVSEKTVRRAAAMAAHIDKACARGLAFLKWPLLTERIKYNRKLLEELIHRGAGGCQEEIESQLASTDPGKPISAKAIKTALGIGQEENKQKNTDEEMDEMAKDVVFMRETSGALRVFEAIMQRFPKQKADLVQHVKAWISNMQRKLQTEGSQP